MFFLETNTHTHTHTHTREREWSSNTKAHHKLHSKVEVEAKDLMIRLSLIIGQNQEINLSLRKLENASIVGKNVT